MPHRTRKSRQPSAKELVGAWLRSNRHQSYEISRDPALVAVRGRTPGGSTYKSPPMRFHIFVPTLQVYLLTTKHCEGDPSPQSREVVWRIKRQIKHARRWGVPCVYVEGRMVRGLVEGDQQVENRLLRLLQGQRSAARDFTPAFARS